jgi:hypothetical protein
VSFVCLKIYKAKDHCLLRPERLALFRCSCLAQASQEQLKKVQSGLNMTSLLELLELNTVVEKPVGGIDS